jgi:hypothetical protein
MGAWYESEEEPAPLAKAEPVHLVVRADRIRSLEEEIHEESADVIRDALAFADIPPDAEEPPYEWVKELGMERAWKRFRTVKYALCNLKEAPVALRIAKDTLVGMAKARASEKSGPRTLNMVVVQMTGTLPQFGEVEVDK